MHGCPTASGADGCAGLQRGEGGNDFLLQAAQNRGQATEERKTIPLLRSYSVFNVSEIDGLPSDSRLAPVSLPPVANWHAEVLARVGLRGGLVHGGGRAFYRIDTDAVHLPERERFTSAAGYDATLLHELGHSTGAAHRLNREFGKRFGDAAYSCEELTSELCSVMVQAELGVDADIEGHASYLSSWSDLLRTQPKALLASASAASKAADYILGRQAETPTE
jgi:antirestriction protein ArdC